MENSSRTLIIAGVILIAISVVAIGMYIFNKASTSTTDTVSGINTQEIEALNAQYELYKGTQKGSAVANLVSKLITSSNKVEDVSSIPGVTINGKINSAGVEIEDVKTPKEASEIGDYISKLGKIKNAIESNHVYNIEFGYGTSGLINEFIISY